MGKRIYRAIPIAGGVAGGRLFRAVAINGEMQNVVTTEVRLWSALKALPVVIPCEVPQRSSFFVKLESVT
jgi:hypothetical protein